MRKVRIYIYGAGGEYRRLLLQLSRFSEQIEVLGIVTTKDIGVTVLDGYKVIRPSDIDCQLMDYVVIAVLDWKEIMLTLFSYNIEKNKMVRSTLLCDPNFCVENHLKLPECKNIVEESENKDLSVIKIWMCDFYEGFSVFKNPLEAVLRKHYKLEYDSIAPDYIIGSVFGKSAQMYDGIRIAYAGENITPDFNIYDYVIGTEYFEIGDRYLYCPDCKIFAEKPLKLALKKHQNVNMEEFLKRKFCCRVVSNGECNVREAFFEKLNQRKFVASGGRTKNNLQSLEPVKDKMKFISNYKFDIAMENSFTEGYISEKIFEAWSAGCIPIYWGDPTISRVYNEEAFVNLHNFSSIQEAIEYILELEQDNERMEKMLKTPILNSEMISGATILEDFFIKIISQPKKKAYRRKSFYSNCGCFIDETCRMDKIFSADECIEFTKWSR